MIKYESDCVGCADGCHGCGLKKETPHLYCDCCGELFDELYEYEDGGKDRELCLDCLAEQFNKISIDDFDEDEYYE